MLMENNVPHAFAYQYTGDEDIALENNNHIHIVANIANDLIIVHGKVIHKGGGSSWRKYSCALLAALLVLTMSVMAVILVTSPSIMQQSTTTMETAPSNAPTVASPSSSLTTNYLTTQMEALQDIFVLSGGRAVDDDDGAWIISEGWSDYNKHDNSSALSNDDTVCSWYGITCNSEKQITHMELANNNLTGNLELMMPSIVSILSLRVLDLRYNNLFGNMTIVSE